MDTLFDALDADWAAVVAAPDSARQLRRWAGRHEGLARFAGLGDLADRNRVAGPAEADEVLAALAALAPCDPLAARVVLQLLLPGCRAVSRRLAWAVPDREERDALVVACAYARIRSYPIERRPAAIAANVLLDTAKAARRAAAAHPATVPLEEAAVVTVDVPEPSAAEELLDILAAEVRSGRLDEADGQAIALTRVGGLSVEEVALRQRCHPGSVRRRRRAAEARLRQAAA